ncbi:MAG: ATP-binding protein [Paracoccaceae bacterium]
MGKKAIRSTEPPQQGTDLRDRSGGWYSARSKEVCVSRIYPVATENAQASGNLSGEGTGLGLAICPKLVSLMRGDIWVEASACGGAEVGFTIELQPCKPAQDEWHAVKPQ